MCRRLRLLKHWSHQQEPHTEVFALWSGVGECAAGVVVELEAERASQLAAIISFATKTGCSGGRCSTA